MKPRNALTVRNQINTDLARKFEQAKKKKVNIGDFIHDFLGSFLAKDTQRAYMQDLNFFFDFLKSGGQSISHPGELESFHFQLYRDHLMERQLASATINRRLVAIRSFIKWSVASKLMSHNPLDTVKLPKVQVESPTVAFDDAEVVAMIDAPDLTTHRGRMHRLAMVLLFNLGLRRNELVNIKLGHIIEERGHTVLRVHGKGDKVRLVPLNEHVQDEIDRYLDALEERQIYLDFDDYLLQTKDTGRKNHIPVDGSTIYRVLIQYARNLGIDKNVSPHSCRATMISHLLDTKQIGIRDVATFAGHANITTTERYDKRRKNLDKSAAYEVDYTDGEDEMDKAN